MTQSSSLSYDDSDPEDPLLEATKNNDLFKVLKILNINTVDNDGNTAFIIAARDGHKKIIIELLKKPDIKPNIQNRQKMTALHCAAREGRRKILQILVRDPRVDSSLQEINKLTFLNYLGLKDKFKSKDVIKQEAFARVTLDTFVNNEVKELYKLIMSKLLTINLTQNDVELSRKTVINNIIRIANNQSKGGELTASATLPEYASNEFIERMIRWRLFYLNEATLSSLDQAILLQQTLADIKKDEKLPNSLNTTTSLPLNQSTLLQQTLTDIKQYEEFPEYLNTATTTNTVDQALLLLQNLAQQKEEKQLSDYL
jgi:hypothetical protein